MPKNKTNSTQPIYQLNVTPAKILEIQKGGKYLIIFSKKDSGVPGDLNQFNEALGSLFEGAKVIAVFAENVNSVKIAELFDGNNESGKESGVHG